MENIGLDLHQRESQLCILTDDGEVIERRIRTTPERLTAVLGPRAPARILLQASTESEWVARHLEALGHTVIVADPNYAPMYATRSARVKTDRRDARTLADGLFDQGVPRRIVPAIPTANTSLGELPQTPRRVFAVGLLLVQLVPS